jgi:hypothetical protein
MAAPPLDDKPDPPRLQRLLADLDELHAEIREARTRAQDSIATAFRNELPPPEDLPSKS